MRLGALKLAQNLEDENALGDKALAGALSEKLARWLILRFAATAQNLALGNGKDGMRPNGFLPEPIITELFDRHLRPGRHTNNDAILSTTAPV